MLDLALTPGQRDLVEQEMRLLRSGEKGEKNSAYYIDFKFGTSRYWAVIHDLRLEFEGKVAQIDHLLINRWFDIYVLESKSYRHGIRITPEGEFLVKTKSDYQAVESPIEQNARHISLLEKVIAHYELMPTKLGVLRIEPKFRSYILVSPQSKIKRPPNRQFDTSNVIKADLYVKRVLDELEALGPATIIPVLATICTSETLMAVAARLARLHRPIVIDYVKRFGITEYHARDEVVSKPALRVRDATRTPNIYHCLVCRKPVSARVAEFCLQKWVVFGGKVYCFDCQKTVGGRNPVTQIRSGAHERS